MAEHEKYQKTNANNDNTTTPSNYIDKSVIEDLFKCDICNIIFDSNIHLPLMVKCGHTFCRKCISLKSNNADKNVNKSCPIDKTKNVMNLETALPNLKLEYIVKKLSNINKKSKIINKPIKKNISPNKPLDSNNTINTVSTFISSTNNTKINNENNTNQNNINKNKEKSTSNSNRNKQIIKQKNKINKINDINFVNTIKNKINSIKNINNNNNYNEINKINIIYKNNNPSNNIAIAKAISPEIKDNFISTQIDEEMNLRNNEKFIFEDEKFNKDINNVTIDTIPINEEMSVGDTSFGGDINELLLKSMMTKKKSEKDETITEEMNSSSSKNIKKLNLMGTQDSLNNNNLNNGNNNQNDMMLPSQNLAQHPFVNPPFKFSLSLNKNKGNLPSNYNQQFEINSKFNNNDSSTNQEDINIINYENNNIIINNNNNNLQRPNTNKIHQIKTIYDKIQQYLKNNEDNNKNTNILNNISNDIIIINDDTINNINIITDNSRSQSQDKITEIFTGDQFTLLSNESKKKSVEKNNETNTINNKMGKTNIVQTERNDIKIKNILNKEKDKDNKNYKTIGNAVRATNEKNTISKITKIDVNTHVHSNSENFTEQINGIKRNKNFNEDNKSSPQDSKKKSLITCVKTENNINENENNVSFDSNSISFRKKILSPNNNLSKSFVNLSGNYLDDEFGDIGNENKDIQIKNEEKNNNNNEFRTINIVKSSKSQNAKIKTNIYYENDNKNNKEIKGSIKNTKDNNNKDSKKDNNKEITNLGNHLKIIYKLPNNKNKENEDKDNSGNNVNINIQNTNNKKNSSNNVNNTNNINLNNTNNTINIKTKQNIQNIQEQQIQKKNNEKKEEIYKKLKNEFDAIICEKQNLISNKSNINAINQNQINNINTTNIGVNISVNNNIRKKQKEAFNNYFKKNKIDWEKVKIKYLPNNEFFIGIFDNEEKYPKKGILIASNGDYYDGEFVNGKKEGEGKLIYMNGNEYEGSFAAGRQNGKGKQIHTDGDTYEGYWKNGKMNGQGVRSYNNGEKYIGNHLNNVRNGKGIYYFANGDQYKGTWVDGKAEGKGVLTFKNGDVYEGDFLNNNMCGKGKFTKKNGDVYTGNFSYGLLNGQGKFENMKEQYIGEFQSGKKHGCGKLYNKEGILIQEGIWKDDKYFGKVKNNNNINNNM